MKTPIILSSLLAAGIAAASFTAGNSLQVGSPMPKGDEKLKNIDGTEITLNRSKKENGLLVVFSCNTCPFVIKHEAIIKEEGKHAKDSKIGYVLINSNEAQRSGADSFDEMKKYAKAQGYDFPYTTDVNSTLADAFGATRTPEVFLFDKNLKLVYKGAYTDDSDPANAKNFYLRDAINAVKDGKAVAVSSTKSVGCSIKRVVKAQD